MALLTRQGYWIAEVEIGQGTVDFTQALALLRKNGYNGYYALEYGAPEEDSDNINLALRLIEQWI